LFLFARLLVHVVEQFLQPGGLVEILFGGTGEFLEKGRLCGPLTSIVMRIFHVLYYLIRWFNFMEVVPFRQ
jgi:hypothetical protein